MVYFAREKKKLPVKNINFMHVKIDFLPVKKTKKSQKNAREIKQSGREKSGKSAKKWP